VIDPNATEDVAGDEEGLLGVDLDPRGVSDGRRAVVGVIDDQVTFDSDVAGRMHDQVSANMDDGTKRDEEITKRVLSGHVSAGPDAILGPRGG
jgi:hypothetical protein